MEKLLQVDMATQNKTRPSSVRVKVEVDLMADFPNRINAGVRKKTGELVEKWVETKLDYVPNTAKHARHNENEWFIIHPELYPREEKEGNLGKLAGEKKEELERRSKVEKKWWSIRGILSTVKPII
ncbi:hypothetical protein MTR67_002614 [Solanum verrucosum]|uniref:Uncharacterized protein n=1 Tax=Solanum verrucosum TaxID=315347 RepID=A0AAF0PWI1_SOLVR|nr:hypothetical protein MTR67_002614 [Solanum verrucosum]